MKHGLTAEGCRARLEAEIAETSIPVGKARDEGRRPAESARSPAAVPVPSISDEVQDEPMDAGEASSKRSAEDSGHETDDEGRGGVEPDPGSMADDSMQEARREAEALGADAVALAEAYLPASQQRAGAFGLSASVAMDLPLDGIWGSRLTRSRSRRG